MPDPTRLLRTLRLARDHTLATPGRTGRVVRPASTEVFVAGDLHGHVGHFQKVFQLADLARHPDRHLVLQEMIHGHHHYPDGGDRSHQMVDLFAALKCQFPRQVHYIMGNHELSQWSGRKISKGEADQNTLFRDGLATKYGTDADRIYAAYHAIFDVLPLAVITPNRVCLTHSLPPPASLGRFDLAVIEKDFFEAEELQPGGAVYSLVWGRDASTANATNFLAKVGAEWLVTGHMPAEGGFAVPNSRQLVLDCAAEPAGCCLFPADRPITHEELVAGVVLL